MRWFVRVAVAAIFATGVVALVAWLTFRASLPDIEGGLSMPGLEAPASIARDADGIPVITAANREDLAFATGFAHAQDRFFQMDTIRRRSAGELSELIGSATVSADTHYRFHRFRSRAIDVLEQLDSRERRLLAHYADGVNAGLASLRAKPFEYFLLGVDPEPWAEEDSVLALYTMFLQLNDERADRDVRRGLAKRMLPGPVFAWLYPEGTPWDAPLIGKPRTVAAIPGPDVYSVRDVTGLPEPANEQGKKDLPGSNNWAVSGALSDSGRAIVSNDMHLGHAAPNIWYQARLVVDGPEQRDVTGVTLPGAPFVVAGSNGHVAWGFTNSYGDWSDAVLLRSAASGDRYLAPGGERRFETFTETIDVKDSEPVSFEIRETIWGPVRDDIDYPDGEIAVSWIAHHSEAINLKLVGLETVESVGDALDVGNTMGIPPQNLVVGDADGNIGWTIAGRIPVRSGFDPLLPADWSSRAGWTGWLPADGYPRVVNPPGGRIWTANARVVDGEALAVIGDGGYDLGARARQIRDALFASDRFTPKDMLEIQYDDRAIFLERWQRLLLEVLDDRALAEDARLVEYRRLVENWIPRAAPEAVGYRLVRAFRLEVQARVFYALMSPAREAYGEDTELRLSNQFEAPLYSLVTERPAHLLPARYTTWRDLLLAAVHQNLDYFDEEFDGPLTERSWGERNTARIRHPMSQGLPWLANYLDMPAEPLNGDVDLPKAQSPAFGASERFSVAPGDEENGIMHMPTGQSGHPLSPFYRRGHSAWVRGLASPFLPDEAVYTLTLKPGG